jgi:poly(3-hydroxybutyrate) depolymerase
MVYPVVKTFILSHQPRAAAVPPVAPALQPATQVRKPVAQRTPRQTVAKPIAQPAPKKPVAKKATPVAAPAKKATKRKA